MRLAFLSALLIIITSCGQTASKENQVTTEPSMEMENAVVVANAKTTLGVEGMMCEVGCVGTIEKTLNNTAGVSTCAVDFETAQAVVDFDSTQIDQAEIIEIINSLADGHYTASVL